MLSAGALVHAERLALPGIEHPVNQLWLCAALTASSLKCVAARKNPNLMGIVGLRTHIRDRAVRDRAVLVRHNPRRPQLPLPTSWGRFFWPLAGLKCATNLRAEVWALFFWAQAPCRSATLRCSLLQQAMQIQSEFLKSQFTNAALQMRQITSEIMSCAIDASKDKFQGGPPATIR